MFHEVAYPFRSNQLIRLNLLAAVNRIMAFLIARTSNRIYVSTLGWKPLLRPMLGSQVPVSWLPVPSNIPLAGLSPAGTSARALYAAPDELLVGHFGTYGDYARRSLRVVIPQVLDTCPHSRMLLIGQNSGVFFRELAQEAGPLANRVKAVGYLSPNQLSGRLRVCDLMVQPQIGGVNSRHSSIMAALAHGIAVVTTEGALTEPFWKTSHAVAMAPIDEPSALARLAITLLNNRPERTRLAAAGHALYDTVFDIRHSVEQLRADVSADRNTSNAAGFIDPNDKRSTGPTREGPSQVQVTSLRSVLWSAVRWRAAVR